MLHDAPSELPTEMSVFVLFIKIRRISSRIQCDFFNAGKHRSRTGQSTPSSVIAAGHTQINVYQYLQEPESRRLQAPIFADPSMLCERQEWYDFLLEKEKLVLLRGSIHSAQKQRNGMPSLHLLKSCIQSAAKSIDLDANLFYQGHITWSRTYFQAIFSGAVCRLPPVVWEEDLRSFDRCTALLVGVATLHRHSCTLQARDARSWGSFPRFCGDEATGRPNVTELH